MIILLILCMVVSFTACGNKLEGTYVSEGLIAQSLKFEGDKITMSAFGINATGTYKIEGDSITFTYNLFGSEQTLTQSFRKEGKMISIGGVAFYKD